jgi:tetratricopeptide (TPR) repeat protein
MPNKTKKDLALKADVKRQAADSLRGYVYQVWHSVHAWLELSDEEILFLEGAEDFDIVDTEKGTAVQVKDTTVNITLHTPAVINAIAHFWHLRNAHPDRVISFKFLTRSQIGIEKEQPFGIGIAGLNLWHLSSRELEAVEKLRGFLLKEGRLPRDLHVFLSNSDSKTILKQVILPITWETGSSDASYVEQAIVRKLIIHGDRYRVPASRSASVVNRLLKEALNKATQKSQRFLDRALFLRIFEEETSIRVSPFELQALNRASSAQNPIISALFQSDSDLALQLAPQIYSGIPSLHKFIAPREMLVNDLCACLSETCLLVLTGSVGMGKTTLAKLVAMKDGGKWNWLTASSHNPMQLSGILRHLAIFIERENTPINIVLDDLDLSPASTRQYEDYFGGLLYTLFARGGRIIITSRNSLTERLSHILGLNTKCFHKVPYFTEEDITDFALRIGCEDQRLARDWAKVILLQTKGHPQLIHARLLNLSGCGWPSLTPDDLLKTPPDIHRERAVARELLIVQLSINERELIYRLSIIVGLFRRDHAIAIAENKPSLEHSGDVFDHLVGPWIEPLHGEYFRLSPLFDNVANQVWSKDKVQSLHCNVAQAILKCGNLTTLEVGAIMLNAWVGRDSGTLAYTINGILTSPENVWKSMAHELSWLIYIGLEPIKAPFPENAFVNFALRMLQFRISIQVDPKVAASIAETWDKETRLGEPKEIYLGQRLLLISQILIYYQVDISPSKLLSLLVEMANLLDEPGQITEAFKNIRLPPLDPFSKSKFDPIPYFFCFIIPRCSGISFLNELLDALEKTPDAIRRRMLSAFKIMESQATLLLDAVWLKVADSDEKDWKSCIAVFKKTIKLTMQWDVPSLVTAAGRGLSIVYDEYLDDPERAIAALDNVRASISKPSVILGEAHATILFRQEHYEDALKIWGKILPEWLPPPEHADMTPIYASRKAGISAAHIGDWKKAIHFFKDGSKRSQPLKNKIFQIAFLADAGFALWMAGEHKESIEVFNEVLSNLEQFPGLGKDLASFTLKKFVGHILLWIENSLSGKVDKLTEPRPGMCSNPDQKEDIRELPDNPIDFSWMHLSQIEFNLGLGSSIFNKVYPRFNQTQYPLVRMFLATLDIQHSFRLLKFESLPIQCDTLNTAYQSTQYHRAQGKEVWEMTSLVDMENNRLKVYTVNEAGLFLAALVALAGEDNLDTAIFGIWRNTTKDLTLNSALMEWIELAESTLSKGTQEVYAIMVDNKQNRESRLLAALKVGTEKDVSPNELFYAHTLLANDLLQSPWKKDIADYFAKLLSRRWLKKTEFPAALISPHFTVPDIQAACKAEEDGIQKAAKILLTASNAVSIRLPQEIIEALRNFAGK